MIYKSEDMRMYIGETQKYALGILENSKLIAEPFVKQYVTKKYERLLLVASGTSYNTVLTAKHFMEDVLKLPVYLSTSYDYAHYNTMFKDTDLVVTVTQEGESTNTVDAIKKANENGIDNITVTENVNNTCTRLATGKVTIECDREYFGPKTKGYTCTVLTLYMMALEAAKETSTITDEEYQNYRLICYKTLNNLSNIISESEKWITDNYDELIACEKAYVIGYGPHVGTAMEGALKCLETVRYFYFSFETEEFLHGPLSSVKDDVYTFIISPKGRDYERSNILYSSMSSQNKHTFAIGNIDGNNDKHVLQGSFINDVYMSVFEYIIPLQLLAYHTFTGKGIDLNVRKYPRVGDVIKTKTEEFRK